MARSHDKVLGVDVDNVLADYTGGLRRIVAEELGRDPAELPDPPRWGHYEDWGFTADDFDRWHRHAVVERRMFRHLDPMPGAADVLRRLSDRGVRIRIVTHRLYVSGTHSIAASDTVDWLDEHEIPYWDLCMVAKKGDVGCDLYVDDAPHNVEALRDIGRRTIVYDWPYNRHLDGPRARSWADIEELCGPMLLSVEKLFEW
ncbi:MAG: 5' nucleotidase, NT5C type [Actinomycetes bacterium]